MCSIDEILAELDVSDSEDENEKSKSKKLSNKQKHKNNVWLHEDADNIVDFTDMSATQKLSCKYTVENIIFISSFVSFSFLLQSFILTGFGVI